MYQSCQPQNELFCACSMFEVHGCAASTWTGGSVCQWQTGVCGARNNCATGQCYLSTESSLWNQRPHCYHSVLSTSRWSWKQEPLWYRSVLSANRCLWIWGSQCYRSVLSANRCLWKQEPLWYRSVLSTDRCLSWNQEPQCYRSVLSTNRCLLWNQGSQNYTSGFQQAKFAEPGTVLLQTVLSTTGRCSWSQEQCARGGSMDLTPAGRYCSSAVDPETSLLQVGIVYQLWIQKPHSYRLVLFISCGLRNLTDTGQYCSSAVAPGTSLLQVGIAHQLWLQGPYCYRSVLFIGCGSRDLTDAGRYCSSANMCLWIHVPTCYRLVIFNSKQVFIEPGPSYVTGMYGQQQEGVK